ncbi:MAG: hypothetical protein CMJ18_26680 [Phycisphaeraceae bacterium]|nr:hypothetical protein [Phycisphaeraceae bacterium]
MADGWLRRLGAGRVEVASAGTRPGGVHPLAIRVMEEADVDISSHTSEHVDRYVDEPFDVVVTVCDRAKEQCPIFPRAARTLHQPFRDPDDPSKSNDELLPVFREVRDEIRAWAKRLLDELAD